MNYHDNPICCEPQVTTFLLEPQNVFGVEKPRKTVKEKKELEKSMVECLNYPMLWDFFDDEITIDDKIERVNKHLENLYRQEELLINNEEKKEDYEKLEREIKHFLGEKESLEWKYKQQLPTILKEASNIPYPEGYWENIRKELDEQREYLLNQKENSLGR